MHAQINVNGTEHARAYYQCHSMYKTHRSVAINFNAPQPAPRSCRRSLRRTQIPDIPYVVVAVAIVSFVQTCSQIRSRVLLHTAGWLAGWPQLPFAWFMHNQIPQCDGFCVYSYTRYTGYIVSTITQCWSRKHTRSLSSSLHLTNIRLPMLYNHTRRATNCSSITLTPALAWTIRYICCWILCCGWRFSTIVVHPAFLFSQIQWQDVHVETTTRDERIVLLANSAQ